MKKLLFLLLFLNNNHLNSQNLFKNPSFEDRKSGHFHISWSYKLLNDWTFIPIGFVANSMCGMSCPYVDTDSTVEKDIKKDFPKSIIRYMSLPHTGKRYIRTKNPISITLFQSELKKPLVKGELYYFEMYYKFTSYTGELDKVASNMLGAYFSNVDFTADKKKAFLEKKQAKYFPQIYVKQYDDTSATWVKIKGVFRANDNYKYCLLGTHRFPDVKMKFLRPISKENPYIEGSHSPELEALIAYMDDVKLYKTLDSSYKENLESEYNNFFALERNFKTDLKENRQLIDLKKYLEINPSAKLTFFINEKEKFDAIKKELSSFFLDKVTIIEGDALNNMVDSQLLLDYYSIFFQIQN